MKKNKREPRQKNASGARASLSAMATTLAERESAVRADEQVADSRHVVADLRDENADLRQNVADLRDEKADTRHDAADRRDEIAQTKSELDARVGAQLREANERLVIATVHAQTLTELAERATAKMSHMAEHDSLTDLPNRSLLSDRLAQAIALAQRHGKKTALMYLDVDHFKNINDSLGHAVGDQLLQSVAKRLQTCVRLSDTVSRQGGDEFVVLLHEIDGVQDALRTAEKLVDAMAQPHLIVGHRLHVTLSIGISIYPDDGQDAEAMVRNADTAMYHVKKNGRNTYQLFMPVMNARAVERLSVEEALHHALEQGEFVLHYQPKVNLETGAITGAEALLRLQQNHQQLLGPTQFISVAEDSGLILPIGKWVLREACRQAQAWLQAGLDFGQIAVNVSAAEFRSKGFFESVRTALVETGLDPRHLELEMTESGLMQDTEQTAEILHALKALGVQIAIDDFGTGYSSLSYLRSFQIDTLKIDQSFVLNIKSDTDEGIVVSAIIAMGLCLKQGVVAEGIETQQQLAFLKSHHCAEGQGFLFSHPVAAEEFASLLTADRH